MLFGTSKDSINSIFCDYYSEFHPKDDIFETSGYKCPDDFEDVEPIGSTRFQLIKDFKSGLCLFNHEGNLYPFTERKILQRKFKVKESAVIERCGEHNSFSENNVYLLETGFNCGNIEYIIFDYNKEKQDSFSSFRKIAYRFPLAWFMLEVTSLKEQSSKKYFSYESLEKLENEQILNQKELKDWQFMSRDTSPSKDEYREKVELPLQNYYFQRNDEVHIWLKFEYFET